MKEKDIEKVVKYLRKICADDTQKTADRITAARLLLEFADRSAQKSDGSLTVTFENIPNEYCV